MITLAVTRDTMVAVFQVSEKIAKVSHFVNGKLTGSETKPVEEAKAEYKMYRSNGFRNLTDSEYKRSK